MQVRKSPKILIVEDEVITAMYLEMILRQEGYHVLKSVGTGENAIRIAKEHKPEVVFMDIRLAGKMDGIQAARSIKEFNHCYIIFMTGYQIDGTREQTTDINPKAFLDKPVDLKKLKNLLDKVEPSIS